MSLSGRIHFLKVSQDWRSFKLTHYRMLYGNALNIAETVIKRKMMNAKVQPCYVNGIPADRDKLPRAVTGDLNLSVGKHPVSGRCCHEAVILGEHGIELLPTLYDATCHCIAAHGIRLRGVCFNNKGQEIVQEWWCVPQLNENPKEKA